jgi:hypothetical protein
MVYVLVRFVGGLILLVLFVCSRLRFRWVFRLMMGMCVVV